MVIYKKGRRWRVFDATLCIDEYFDTYKQAKEFSDRLEKEKYSHRDELTNNPIFI